MKDNSILIFLILLILTILTLLCQSKYRPIEQDVWNNTIVELGLELTDEYPKYKVIKPKVRKEKKK